MKKAKKKNMILGMIFRIANAWQQKSNSLLGELTLRQFMLLAAMKDMPQTSANLSQLAHAFGGTRQNVRQLVGSLSDKGFVQTGPSDKDKRELLVSLTDKAHAFFGCKTNVPFLCERTSISLKSKETFTPSGTK